MLAPATDTICIFVSGDPRGKGRPRSRIAGGRGRQFIQVYTDPETRAYEDRLRAAAALAMSGHDMFLGPLEVRVEARFAVPASWSNKKSVSALAGAIRPTGKPDADNILKNIDAFHGVIWKDDSQAVDTRVIKIYSGEPGLAVTVRPIGEPLFEVEQP
jgi:Holliday junction resolvase RusA-like endonuclease